MFRGRLFLFRKKAQPHFLTRFSSLRAATDVKDFNHHVREPPPSASGMGVSCVAVHPNQTPWASCLLFVPLRDLQVTKQELSDEVGSSGEELNGIRCVCFELLL